MYMNKSQGHLCAEINTATIQALFLELVSKIGDYGTSGYTKNLNLWLAFETWAKGQISLSLLRKSSF